MLKMLETVLVFALTTLVANYRDEIVGFFTRVGDKLNDKIEGTETQLDDIAKGELVAGFNALIAELSVDGVDA